MERGFSREEYKLNMVDDELNVGAMVRRFSVDPVGEPDRWMRKQNRIDCTPK